MSNKPTGRRVGRPMPFSPGEETEKRAVHRAFTVDTETLKRLERLGGGNLSAGVRRAALIASGDSSHE